MFIFWRFFRQNTHNRNSFMKVFTVINLHFTSYFVFLAVILLLLFFFYLPQCYMDLYKINHLFCLCKVLSMYLRVMPDNKNNNNNKKTCLIINNMTVAMRWNGMKQSYDEIEEYWCFANIHHCAWDLFYVCCCCCCFHRNQFRDKRDSILIFSSYIFFFGRKRAWSCNWNNNSIKSNHKSFRKLLNRWKGCVVGSLSNVLENLQIMNWIQFFFETILSPLPSSKFKALEKKFSKLKFLI